MKKSIFILSLVFAVTTVFSTNNAGARSTIAAGILEEIEINDIIKSYNVDLGDGYSLTGTVLKVNASSYSYIGFLSHNGAIVGTITGSFAVEIVNGLESVIEDTVAETYSNEETSAVVKAKHNAVKNAIVNVR